MNRVYLKTYGCQMNERDSEAVAALLRARGYAIVHDEASADIILLNTCSVRDQAEQKAIGKAQRLLRRKRDNPHFKLGILGCMAQNRGAELLERLPDLDLIAGTQKFHRVPEQLDHLIASEQGRGPRPSSLIDLEPEEDSQNAIRDHTPGQRQVSAFVSIMQGCNMRCAFCIVPTTRGSERYRPMEAILEEVEELAAAGTREVTLLGQIVNHYAPKNFASKSGTSAFVQLLERINDIPGIERIRFTSPHPRGFRRDLIEAYRDLPKLCEYVHLPLQSGSDAILKAMKRPYSVERYRRIVDDLRALVPHMAFSTDIIVGFPGETEADFEATRQLFEELAFEMAFIFKYSIRTGTPAATMPDQVPQAVKEARNQALLQRLETQSLAHKRALIGTTQEVLVESPARKGQHMLMGRTRTHRKVVFPGSENLIGELMDVEIDNVTVNTLIGTARNAVVLSA